MNKRKNIILISVIAIVIVVLAVFLFVNKHKKKNVLENVNGNIVYYDENGNMLKDKLK